MHEVLPKVLVSWSFVKYVENWCSTMRLAFKWYSIFSSYQTGRVGNTWRCCWHPDTKMSLDFNASLYGLGIIFQSLLVGSISTQPFH